MSGSLPCGLVAVGSDGGTGALTADGLRLSLEADSRIEIGFRRFDEASVDATLAWRSERTSFTLALLPLAGNRLRVEFGTGLRVVDVRPTTGEDVGPRSLRAASGWSSPRAAASRSSWPRTRR
jgi:hypothetical protein